MMLYGISVVFLGGGGRKSYIQHNRLMCRACFLNFMCRNLPNGLCFLFFHTSVHHMSNIQKSLPQYFWKYSQLNTCILVHFGLKISMIFAIRGACVKIQIKYPKSCYYLLKIAQFISNIIYYWNIVQKFLSVPGPLHIGCM